MLNVDNVADKCYEKNPAHVMLQSISPNIKTLSFSFNIDKLIVAFF